MSARKPNSSSSLVKNLKRLNCASSAPCDEVKLREWGPVFGQQNCSSNYMQKDYVIDDLVLHNWNTATNNPSFTKPSSSVEISLHNSKNMADLAKEMRMSRLEDETRLRELGAKPKPQNIHSSSAYKSHRGKASPKQSIARANSHRGKGSPTEPLLSNQRQYVYTQQSTRLSQDHYVKDSFSVGTGSTEQETVDGNCFDGFWPDDDFSRELNAGSSKELNTGRGMIRQVNSLEQPPRKSVHFHVPRARSTPAAGSEDETCDVNTCRMSAGICVDCTKCAKHCTCSIEAPKRRKPPAVCNPSTCKQLICGDCSRCTQHCECTWGTQTGSRQRPVPVRKWTADKKSPTPVYSQPSYADHRTPLRHDSNKRLSPKASQARQSGYVSTPPRSEKKMSPARRGVPTAGPHFSKRKIIYRNIQQ